MKGTIAVKGMAMADVYPVCEIKGNIRAQKMEDVEVELKKLDEAKKGCMESLTRLIEKLQNETDKESAEILDFQLLLLEDDNYFGAIREIVKAQKVNCEYAIVSQSESYRSELAALDNPYLNERTADITDLERRLLNVLSGGMEHDMEDGSWIVAAEDLTPSQVVELGKKRLKGIILEKGGLSSHCVILARSMNIPCMIGVKGALGKMKKGEKVLLDCIDGEVIIRPDKEALKKYLDYCEKMDEEKADLERFKHRETKTKDGKDMKVYANVSSETEIEELKNQGGEGVGLMRTEMLYMERNKAPDEETQYQIYSKIAKELEKDPLIIRTLDVGGDKHISYLNIPAEDNPFLGYRAIRYCLDHPEIFKSQLSAILRAGVCGTVKMMIPMVSDLSEIKRTRDMIDEVKQELDMAGIKHGDMAVGMMVETPSAAVMADRFAKVVDFFSIGTNDLTQYLFAADRNNEKVASLNSYYHPALLRMIDHISRCAHENEIEVDICGQAGEVEELIPLWVGMEIDNLSVSIPSIPRVRRAISCCSFEKCRELVKQVLHFSSDKEVIKFMREEKTK